ncbi:MAG: VOC family protein [Acholeplasmataceae bacterium]
MIHPFHQETTMHISSIELLTSNIEKAKAFYIDLLGLSILNETSSSIDLGTSNNHLLIKLIENKDAAKNNKTLGLYHFALLLSSKAYLASVLYQLSTHNYPITGLSDHGVSLAIYLDDPDGNGIEIYVDRDKSMWPTQNGQIEMYTKALDLNDLMKSLPKEPYVNIDPNTVMGHLHFHVADLDQAKNFFVDVLGFEMIQNYFNSALFISSSKYHHHLGLNTWNKGASLRQPSDVGLISYQLNIPKKDFLTLEKRLSKANVPITNNNAIKDPLGQTVYITVV